MSFIDPMLSLQDIDMRIWQCRQELEDLPRRKKEEELRLENAARRQAEMEMSLDSSVSDEEKAAVEAEISDVNAFIAEISERAGDLKSEIESLLAKRAEAAKEVRPEHLLIYDRLRVSRHPTIVKLANGTCGGCHLKQPPQVAHLVKRDNQLVTCEMCGRILY